jgi:CDP-paratose synthetase
MGKPGRFLVTGATGFLGGHLVRKLSSRGDIVGAIVRPTSRKDALQALPNVQVLDVSAKPSAIAAFGPADAIIHTATCYGRNSEPASAVIAANVLFPITVLEEAVASGTTKVVNTDSYFTKPGAFTNYLLPYSLSKRYFVELGRELTRRRGMPFINMRLEHVYGEEDDPAKFVTSLLRQCIRGVSDIPLTAGAQERDFVHVDDVVSAFLKVLESPSPLGDFAEYEVGTGTGTTVRSFAERVNRISGNRSNLAFGALPYRSDEIMASRADIARLEELGWQPTTLLEDGLARLIEHERKRLQ